MVEVAFKAGKKEGAATAWHENGQKKTELVYKADKQEGMATSWHENGQKKSELFYKGGKQEGLGTEWRENGQKEREMTYKDGKVEGRVTTWGANGQKESEGIYEDGKLVGTATTWRRESEQQTEVSRIQGTGRQPPRTSCDEVMAEGKRLVQEQNQNCPAEKLPGPDGNPLPGQQYDAECWDLHVRVMQAVLNTKNACGF